MAKDAEVSGGSDCDKEVKKLPVKDLNKAPNYLTPSAE